MKTAVFMVTDDNTQELLAATIKNKQEYCERWGYDLHVMHFENYWYRFVQMRQLFDKYDEVLYLDTDTVITNMTIPLHHRWRWKGFVIAADLFGFNSGVIIARKQKMTLQLITAINTLGEFLANGHPWKEQEALRRLLTAPPYVHHPFLQVADQRSMNIYYENSYENRADFEEYWQPGDWILHMPGMLDSTRLQIINIVLPQVVR
jgi:lipopolysaccharide biosynthesis glycosyltransferase